MDISSLDESLLRYCNRGLADSTQRTYKSGINRYLSFCRLFGVSTPFPVSEPLLCYFVTSLAREGVAPSTVRTYLAAVRHAQIMRGHHGPWELSSLPRLRLVQNGVRRERALTGQPQTRQRLPITPTILRKIRPLAWRQGTSAGFQETLVWAAATVCFFGFFRAGEITVPTTSAFDAATHLSWGDVAIDVRAWRCGYSSSVQRLTNTGGGRRCSSVPLAMISAQWRPFARTWPTEARRPEPSSARRAGLH